MNFLLRIKICGLTRREDIALCVEAGVHALGFVTEYPKPVPWNLSAEEAAALVAAVPPFVTSCMVAAGEPRAVLDLARRVRPTAVQLHGGETLEQTARIAAALRRIGIGCIRALRVNENGTLDFCIADPAKAAALLSATPVAALLVDSGSARLPGGSGISLNVRVYDKVCAHTRLPVIAAGGLRADNLKELLGGRRPYAIDVLTGVENAHGVKSRQKIGALTAAAAAL